jgi:pimeloyl-ACP methyl ester carboxylesterase
MLSPRHNGAAKRGSLRAVTREARAFVRLATLLPYDLEAIVPRGVQDGDDAVVLVHGSLATAGAWRPLRERLERVGARTATFTYGPTRGVEEIAAGIGELLAELPARSRIHLVGHSLGGLAVRWFVQELPRDARVLQTIAVAAPFSGATRARLLPGRPGRDMQPGSEILRRLAASACGPGIPHLSIFGSDDTAVPSSTAFAAGDRLVVPDAGHNSLLFADEVASSVLRRVRGGLA